MAGIFEERFAWGADGSERCFRRAGGGDDRIRTDDPLLAKQVRHLSTAYGAVEIMPLNRTFRC